MGIILAAMTPLSVNALNQLCEEDAALDAGLIIRSLGSVLAGATEQDVPVQTLHISFRDFVTDPKRSGGFCVNVEEQSSRLAIPCLRIMVSHLQQNICNVEYMFIWYSQMGDRASLVDKHIPESLQYACGFWIHHLLKLRTYSDVLYAQMRNFMLHHLLHWIEALSIMNQLQISVRSLYDFAIWLQVHTISLIVLM